MLRVKTDSEQAHIRKFNAALFLGTLCAHARMKELSAQWFAHALKLHSKSPVVKA